MNRNRHTHALGVRRGHLKLAALVAAGLLLAACNSGLDKDLPLRAAAVEPLTARVSASADDAEELSSGEVRTDQSTLDFPRERRTQQTLGLRFGDLAIPQGAVVTQAYLEFKASATDSKRVTLLLRAEAADSASTFSAVSEDLTSRARTSASVTWKPRGWSRGKLARTPDLSNLVQEVVDRDGWRDGNALAFVVTGDSRAKRSAYAYDGRPADAPTLHVWFEMPEESTPPTNPEPADPTKVSQAQWHTRLMTTIDEPKYHLHPALTWLDPTRQAQSGDTYKLGRSFNNHISVLINAFRTTGDVALLDEIDRLMEVARAQLADYNGDGYLNWRYLNSNPDSSSAPYVGDDYHQMDDMLAHTTVAAAANVLKENASRRGQFGEHAAFWTDYLENHFEAKWRARRGKSEGFPFLYKDLTHAYAQWIRYHYYMAKLTGDGAYLREAERMAAVVKARMVEVGTSNGPAYIWDHRINDGKTASLLGCQPTKYVHITTQALWDLAAGGFSAFKNDTTFMQRVAGGVAEFIVDDGANSFAPDICGGVSRGGLTSKSSTRLTNFDFLCFPHAAIGAWDRTGEIERVAYEVYAATEKDLEKPARSILPAIMVFLSN